MTSRFGKTYSRKGGEGTSKFDEVLSTKRGTLSTKWGDTTYKAKVGSKRAGAPKNDSILEVYKRPRPSGDGMEDPFGFDSDEESKPVSSRSKSSPAKPSAAEPPQAERPGAGLSLNMGSMSSLQGGGSHGLTASRGASSWMNNDRSQPPRIVEDTARFFNSSTATTGNPPSSSSSSSEPQHSYSWYLNASESDKKPLPQTTTLKTGAKAECSYDAWDDIMGLRPPSPSIQEPRNPAPTLSWATAGVSAQHQKPPNTNCRTYRRPNKGKTSDSVSDPPKSASDGGSDKTTDRGGEEFSADAAPSSGSSGAASGYNSVELGEAGWQRKKTEILHTRFKPTQTKSKKDSKLESFGFEDAAEGHQEENNSAENSYKIQYFGFDDMSNSDGEEDDEDDSGAKARRRAKKEAAAKRAPMEPMEETPTEEPPDPFEALERLEALERTERLERLDRPSKETKKNAEKESRIRTGWWPGRLAPPAGLQQGKQPRRTQTPSGGSSAHTRSAEKLIPKTPLLSLLINPVSPTKAVYNARHWAVESEEEAPQTFVSSAPAPASGRSSKDSSAAHKDDGLFKAPPPPPKVTKCVTLPTDLYQDTVTALKCRKEHKELYTVVQHVKHFNDVVEFGENQEFTDDFEYLATGLKSGQPLNTRCLSLATRCAMPSFRMHLRARGKVAQVFKTLNDAPQHSNLALCTATLMYILSRDRLNMDLDRSCLDLMIRLLEMDHDQGPGAVSDPDAQFSAREIAKIKEKIRKLCDTVHNKHLDLQNITTGHLAMETLLSLTSKRAGDWFKEELRLLGGLDHIVDKVGDCVENLNQEDEKEKMVSSLWGAERCLRVLESVTVHNPENQSYLIAYKDSSLIISSAKKAALHLLLSKSGQWFFVVLETNLAQNMTTQFEVAADVEAMIQRYSRELNSDGAVGKAVEDCMRAIIGVLLNLTHDNEWGSTKTGEQEDLILTALNCVLKVPQYLPQEQRFDIRVLGLGLLINLVEYSARNKYFLMEMEMEGPCDATVLINPLQELASTGPLSAIAALVQEAPKPPLDKSALQHAGKHMEDSIVASYTALLLGCLCQGSPLNVTTCDVGTTGQKSISRIIDYLEHC
ncbi:Wings apart-like protein like [Dissostichus eleginoides]|uniref:Wings apart-like protein homolog n=1 Tax=Dissostichus eleginoides TaxID=100907 RepID=A0AAD9BEJ1_DISEL|nr:Wings apart-like protein like [Dissostichus eleginoides]